MLTMAHVFKLAEYLDLSQTAYTDLLVLKYECSKIICDSFQIQRHIDLVPAEMRLGDEHLDGSPEWCSSLADCDKGLLLFGAFLAKRAGELMPDMNVGDRLKAVQEAVMDEYFIRIVDGSMAYITRQDFKRAAKWLEEKYRDEEAEGEEEDEDTDEEDGEDDQEDEEDGEEEEVSDGGDEVDKKLSRGAMETPNKADKRKRSDEKEEDHESDPRLAHGSKRRCKSQD